MRTLIDWQDDAENAAPEERATVADLRLILCDVNITQHFCGRITDDRITVALYGIAHGLVHQWWTIFGARDRDVSLASFRNGYLFPDLRIRFDGSAFEVAALQQEYRSREVRFWAGPVEVMSRAAGEALLEDLIVRVLQRLDERKVRGTGAHLRWQRVQSSRQQSDEARFCEAAGSLELDPYKIAEEPARFIEMAEALFEGEAVIDFVCGGGASDHGRLVEWVDRMRNDRSSQYRLPDLAGQVDAALKSEVSSKDVPAWSVGYRRARTMRKILGIGQDRKFSSFQDIAKALGAGASYNVAPKVDGIRALRSERPDGWQIHLRNHGDSAEAHAQHLFAMARALGDAACFPETKLAPINDVRNAYRQAAGRAFAAEFLAPVNEIRSMLEDRRDRITIADAFSVSTSVVDRQIENQRRIDEACA